MSDKARLSAFKAVKRVFEGAFSNLIDFGNELTGRDRAFAESIALGTIEHKITLEEIIKRQIKKGTKQDVICLLMTGAEQILYMDRVPDSAACDETVEIAKKIFGKSAASFVNAVMRSICRSKNEIYEFIEKSEGFIKYSVNQELFELIKEQYPDKYDEIFASFFGKRPTFLRVNNTKSDANEVATLVDGEVIDEKCVVCDSANNAVKQLECGSFYIQGAASQEAVKLLDAQPFDTVIDVCACPGGKTLGAAIDMNNKGQVFSFDIHDKKLPLIEKGAKKLGITIIKTQKQDARQANSEFSGIADRVICDVPCSGTGVMGSKPEIKYKSPDDFKRLYPTQRAIIRAASSYLKRGGIMVYSTCSINKIENEEVVSGFLSENDGFELITERTFLPFEAENEGFYTAKIKRIK